MKKFGGLGAATAHLRHILREVKRPANEDIDPSQTHRNYSLGPKRKIKPYAYLKRRVSELHTIDREDTHVLCGWVVTKPKDLPPNEERQFFERSYEFLKERYGGEKNVVAAEVHKDEAGEAHLHFYFVPTVGYTENANMLKVIEYFEAHPGEENISKVARELGISRKTVRRWKGKGRADICSEKICAKEVLNRQELCSFHPDYQEYLDRCGLHAKVHTGITAAQGGNRTVEELKRERDIQRELTHEVNHEINY